ncbi:MAG: flavodoxin [Firmicutes bacterium]|nr:flavodoxin [Bacillota bacterium]
MKKIAVVYWSGTGNTQMMAEAIALGAAVGEMEVSVLPVDQVSSLAFIDSDAIAIGCPAMGDEVLEESEMEPFISSLSEAAINKKPLVLFGSYDWGDGKWMQDWETRMCGYGALLVEQGLIIRNTPDETGLSKCWEIGKKLATVIS